MATTLISLSAESSMTFGAYVFFSVLILGIFARILHVLIYPQVMPILRFLAGK